LALLADYVVMRDISPNPGTFPAGERTFIVDLPGGIVVTGFGQSPFLMFVVRAPAGSVNLEIDVNGQRLLNLAEFNAPIGQTTIHEVVDRTLLRAGSRNDFVFRVVSAQANAALRISNIILWFQRDSI